jgi:hypothetical protein
LKFPRIPGKHCTLKNETGWPHNLSPRARP